MKRKLKRTAAVLAVLLLGFGTVLLLWPRDRITVESWHKIRIGMTQKEVKEILGKSAVSLRSLRKHMLACGADSAGALLDEVDGSSESEKYWIGQNGIMVIGFDKDRKVVDRLFQALRSPEPHIIDRLRDWLGW